jgi:integrase
MSESHSTAEPTRSKPAKPYPEFPLTAHPAGQWCKKIRGQLHYFGPWDDPDGALTKYLEQKDALHAGRKPRPDTDALTVKDLANAFLNEKKALQQAGELSPRTWDEYRSAAELLVSHLGKSRLVADLDPEDFSDLRKHMARKWGPTRLGNVIQRIRCIFKFGGDNGLISKLPCYGQGFKRPSKKTLRLNNAKKGAKLFTAEEIRRLLAKAGVQLKAMILLGINCGFGNADCGTLPLTALDLDNAIIDFPRPKTGISRRCPLWSETVTAVREALAKRPDPKDPANAGLVFITKYGERWAKDIIDNPVSKETAKLLRDLGINGRQGVGFYTLRHTFRTMADEAKDQPAADFIMGHEVPHMSSIFRETISDERLRAVSDHVRAWLFTVQESEPTPAEEPTILSIDRTA